MVMIYNAICEENKRAETLLEVRDREFCQFFDAREEN